jgi:hypothetical protein
VTDQDERVTGKVLSDKWNVRAAHALYRENGDWYHRLTDFPGAYFDSSGYVRFETEWEYTNSPYLKIGDTVHVPQGIAAMPGYVRCPTVSSLPEDDEVDDDHTYAGGSIYPYDMPDEVDIREEPQTVFEWLRKLKGGRLIVNPEFQRNLVWDPEQKSRFIESALLNIPLPPLYVNQTVEGRYIIVDGRQRTATLDEYINKDEFSLSGLKLLKSLNGLTFGKLEPRFQGKLEDKKFLIYVIKPTVPMQMVYDIFNRINTGGTQLTQQEIRNCFYIGKATRILKELSEQEYFKQAIDWGISPLRMKDREAILRYLAFRILDYEIGYKNDMDAFLGNALERMNLMTEAELDGLRMDFRRVMKRTYEFFGNRNFRLPTDYTRGRINIAVMESVCNFFSKQSDQSLLDHRETIMSNYETLLRDEQYIDAVRFSTGDRKRVIRRFHFANAILGRFQ